MDKLKSALDLVIVFAERLWLLELFLKSSLLCLVFWLVYWLLQSRQVVLRYYFWRLSAVVLLLLPLFSVVDLGWRFDVRSPETAPAEIMTGERTQPKSVDRAKDLNTTSPNGTLPLEQAQPSKAGDPALEPPIKSTQAEIDTWAAYSPWLNYIWLLGVALAGLRLLTGSFLTRRIIHRSGDAGPVVYELSSVIAKHIGVKSNYSIRLTDKFPSPAIVWSGRPVLLIPSTIDLADKDTIRSILAHELAHLKGRDLLWNGVFHFIGAAFWFNPLVWRMRRTHSLLSELQADAISARACGSCESYSRVLASVALLAKEQSVCYGLAMARRSGVRYRIEHLPKTVRELPVSKRSLICVAALVPLVGLPVGSLQFVQASVHVEVEAAASESGQSTPILPPPAATEATEITLSQLDGNKESARERAFTEWLSPLASQARFNELTSANKFPIYSERSEVGVRDLYVEKPKYCSFWTLGSMEREEFLKRNQNFTEEGYTLLSSSVFTGKEEKELYWATWIDASFLDEVMHSMKKHGISQAVIKE